MTRPGRQERRDRALEREGFLEARAGDFDRASVERSAAALRTTAQTRTLAGAVLPKGFPTGDAARWVPIGPSVVRRGQANGRPRVSGRIRDLAVSGDGRRAYAGSAMGGVWYTGDGGATWDPLGGWAELGAGSGGDNNAQACGSLLVDFKADRATDFVLVGTGETVPAQSQTGNKFGGLGVLAATGPANAAVGANPWEAATGLAALEGLGIFRLARRPGRVSGSTTAGTPDEVLAATSQGLFLGVRGTVAGATGFAWSKLPGIDLRVFGAAGLPAGHRSPAVTDVGWLPGGANGRIVVAVNQHASPAVPTLQRGVAYSDDRGATFTWLPGASVAGGAVIQGRSTLALAPGTNRLYVLSALPPPAALLAPDQRDTPSLFRVADITVPAPAAVAVAGVPGLLWRTQRDYDQALAVDTVAGTDRVYLGGSFFDLGQADFGASLWCFDVVPNLGANPALGPTAGVSRQGAPTVAAGGGGDGADQPGHIGTNVHADVHALRLAGAAAATRQLWVGCDGGVYVSDQAGRVNSFASRATGLAVLQPGFVAGHPTSSHFVAGGFQDNGTQVRSGDTTWEAIMLGDGGGTVFHPRRSHFVVSQFIRASWSSVPATGFVSPTSRLGGGGATNADRENQRTNALFYSGAASVATSATEGRIAVGTARVWVTENLGAGTPHAWRVLPFVTGAATGPLTDPRPNGTDPPAQQAVGVPSLVPAGADINANGVGPLGLVVTVKWSTPTELLALFANGVVRWTENPAGQWNASVVLGPGFISAAFNGLLTDIAPIPGSRDFFVTTTGDPASQITDVCYVYDSVLGFAVRTTLRDQLPAPTPLEPAYSVTVDPAQPTNVYVGTVTGLWRGVRDAVTGAVAWTRFVNGLPQAAVQDLSVWHDPAGGAGTPRLLRAAVQSRGVWEVDLTANEPSRTYVRVHPRDDRRRFPTPMANPRLRPTATLERVFESPDVVVRPRSNPAAAPRWLLGNATITQGNVRPYQLWTFQTAFRWLYPSVVADGQWSDAFGDLVELHRTVLQPALGAPLLPLGRLIDRRMWDAVVGGTRLDPVTGAVSANAAHPLAVYRPPWHTPSSLTGSANEVDVLETVQPRSVVAGVWQVHSEPSTVEVLLHHRDTRPVNASAAFAILLWRSGPSGTALLASGAVDLAAFAAGVAAGSPVATPAGWNLQTSAAGASLHGLPVSLDARMPRAVSVDVDLSGVAANHRVLFLAVVGSAVDPCTTPPVALPAAATVTDLVRRWPYAALRLVQVSPRP